MYVHSAHFFANIFMDEFENSHMETLKELGVITWMRYVDDVISVIRDETCRVKDIKTLIISQSS